MALERQQRAPALAQAPAAAAPARAVASAPAAPAPAAPAPAPATTAAPAPGTPPAAKAKPSVKLPTTVIGMIERLAKGGSTGPVAPNGGSARPLVAKLPASSASSALSASSAVSSGSQPGCLKPLVPGINQRGPIQAHHDLTGRSRPSASLWVPGSAQAQDGQPAPSRTGSAESAASTANKAAAAGAKRATVDALLRGPWGDIPVGQPHRGASDWEKSRNAGEPKRRPVVRRRTESGPLSRSSSAASNTSTCSRTSSAGSDASGGWEQAPVSSAPSAASSSISATTTSTATSAAGSCRADTDKENQSRKGGRKYPTADVRAFVKGAKLPSTVVPRLLELLAEKDMVKLPVRFLMGHFSQHSRYSPCL